MCSGSTFVCFTIASILFTIMHIQKERERDRQIEIEIYRDI